MAAEPGFVDARRGRAILSARLGNREQALQEINWCLEKEPQAGVTLYAAACVAALAAERFADSRAAEQALTFLELAFAQQYGQQQADKDPDLNGVRNHPGFARLLTRAQKRTL